MYVQTTLHVTPAGKDAKSLYFGRDSFLFFS